MNIFRLFCFCQIWPPKQQKKGLFYSWGLSYTQMNQLSIKIWKLNLLAQVQGHLKKVWSFGVHTPVCRSDSLHNIVKSLDPDIIVLCEIRAVTANTIRTQFKALGYEPFLNKASGMIVAAKFKFDMVNVTSTLSSRIISTSVKVGNTHMTITGVYGPQETEKEVLRSQFYEELETEIVAGLHRGNHTLVIGDFNSKIAIKFQNCNDCYKL